MNNKLWVITPYFNPIGYQSLADNLEVFSQRILSQGANLCVVKLDFPANDKGLQVKKITDNHIEITTSANSILWHKEAMINIAINLLKETKYIAWIDGDVLLPDGWVELAELALAHDDILQLFKRVHHLKKGDYNFGGECTNFIQGIVWQKKIHKNWLGRRQSKVLPFAAPGFAWAATTEFLRKAGGLYSKAITGSGDVIFVDALMDSHDLHVYHSMLTPDMRMDVEKYHKNVKKLKPTYNYLPIDIYHLWHGDIVNRQYVNRHNILTRNKYNPNADLIFNHVQQVYELSKTNDCLSFELQQYFEDRRDDDKVWGFPVITWIKKKFVDFIRWLLGIFDPPGY